MSGQFANKQFAGDQFAGKQFGANEGDSGVVWLSANLTGSGALVGAATGVEESTRRSRRRPALRAIREGAAFAAVVEVRTDLMRAKARGAAGPPTIIAFAESTSSRAEVAVLGASGAVRIAGTALASAPRAVRARAHAPVATAGASGAVKAVVAAVSVRRPHVRAGSAAHPEEDVSATSRAYGARASGVRNPSDAEFIAMVLALRKRHLTSRSAGRILRRC